jgi:hypothetical protein
VRARIHQRATGEFVVTWAATRNVRTREEAERLARLELPPPSRPRADLTPAKLRAFIVWMHERGASPRLISAGLRSAGVLGPRGGTLWPASVRAILKQEQRHAERARDEWNITGTGDDRVAG